MSPSLIELTNNDAVNSYLFINDQNVICGYSAAYVHTIYRSPSVVQLTAVRLVCFLLQYVQSCYCHLVSMTGPWYMRAWWKGLCLTLGAMSACTKTLVQPELCSRLPIPLKMCRPPRIIYTSPNMSGSSNWSSFILPYCGWSPIMTGL